MKNEQKQDAEHELPYTLDEDRGLFVIPYQNVQECLHFGNMFHSVTKCPCMNVKPFCGFVCSINVASCRLMNIGNN